MDDLIGTFQAVYRRGVLTEDVVMEPNEPPAGAPGLGQNFPNPFNGETVIRYRVPVTGKDERVSLKVFDLLGREVATLVDDIREPGWHSVTWQADAFPTGVYFYRETVAGTVKTGRAIIVK